MKTKEEEEEGVVDNQQPRSSKKIKKKITRKRREKKKEDEMTTTSMRKKREKKMKEVATEAAEGKSRGRFLFPPESRQKSVKLGKTISNQQKTKTKSILNRLEYLIIVKNSVKCSMSTQ